MKTSKILLLALVLVSLVGCATDPVPLSRSTPAPLEQILASQYMIKPGTSALQVTVIRDNGSIVGAGIKITIGFNGTPIVTLWPGQRATFYVPENGGVVTASIWTGAIVDFTVNSSMPQPIFLRTGGGAGGITLMPTVP